MCTLQHSTLCSNCIIRIQFSDDNDCVLFLKGVMEVKDSLVVQLGKQVHLSQSRCLLLGPCGYKLCGIVHFAHLLRHTFYIGKRTSGGDRKLNFYLGLT